MADASKPDPLAAPSPVARENVEGVTDVLANRMERAWREADVRPDCTFELYGLRPADQETTA